MHRPGDTEAAFFICIRAKDEEHSSGLVLHVPCPLCHFGCHLPGVPAETLSYLIEYRNHMHIVIESLLEFSLHSIRQPIREPGHCLPGCPVGHGPPHLKFDYVDPSIVVKPGAAPDTDPMQFQQFVKSCSISLHTQEPLREMPHCLSV